MSGFDVITQARPQAGRSPAAAPSLAPAATPTATSATTPSPVRVHAGALYPSPLPAGARLQEFEISAVIGQGGFGIVYLARDLSLQRSVAIKEYMPVHLAGRDAELTVRPLTAGQAEVFELGRRSFIAEARMLARFKHPGLVEVLRFWEQNGTAYMAMPYYDGATLTQYLARHPGVATEAWLTRTLKPLVDALGHMHDEDCFHRDVAPDNILILKDGSAVLLDLGAARRVIANDAQAMTVMLKPGYAPIEQYSDDPRFRQGPWTDIYAMAAVFFFAVSGKAPPASASRVMRDSVSPLAGVRPAGFSDAFLLAIDKGLSLQPEDRPRSIAEFRALLFAASPVQPSASLPPARKAAGQAARGKVAEADDPFAPPRAASVTPAGVAIAAAVLLLVLTGAWFSLPPAGSPGDVATVPAPAIAVPAAAAAVATPAPSPQAAAVAPTVAIVSAGPIVPPALIAAPESIASPAPIASPTPIASPVQNASPVPAAPVRAAPVGAATPSPTPPPAPAKLPSAVAAEAKAAATATGTIVLSVKPWAEVRVNGVVKGISPPMKQLSLPAGRHTIEFRNPAAAPVQQQVEVRANQKTTVSQQF